MDGRGKLPLSSGRAQSKAELVHVILVLMLKHVKGRPGGTIPIRKIDKCFSVVVVVGRRRAKLTCSDCRCWNDGWPVYSSTGPYYCRTAGEFWSS